MLFISPKKLLFSFSRYSHFCISIFLSLFSMGLCFMGWLKINLKVYDIINCLNKNLVTQFVWYPENGKMYDTESSPTDRVLTLPIPTPDEEKN